jgi:hypothetical protein
MTRHVLILGRQDIADKACRWIRQCPPGTRVEFREPKRSLPQNARFWAMLTDWAEQVEHNGRKYKPEQWKSILMQAFGKQVDYLPTLDGEGFFPVGMKSSELSVAEMAELQTFIEAEGAARGVRFHAKGMA